MGLIVLHSGHYAKVFKALMGTTCSLKWREASDKERIWNIMPSHPIARGIPDHFEIPAEEMRGEPLRHSDTGRVGSSSPGSPAAKSSAAARPGIPRQWAGLYFRPGHETYPTYHHADVQKVITNAVHWARPTVNIPDVCPEQPSSSNPSPMTPKRTCAPKKATSRRVKPPIDTNFSLNQRSKLRLACD